MKFPLWKLKVKHLASLYWQSYTDSSLDSIGFYAGGVDYRIQDYRSAAKYERDGSKYIDLKIVPVNDDLVEDDEVYYLEIVPTTLPDRIVPGDPSKCKIVIQNDDGEYHWIIYY